MLSTRVRSVVCFRIHFEGGNVAGAIQRSAEKMARNCSTRINRSNRMALRADEISYQARALGVGAEWPMNASPGHGKNNYLLGMGKEMRKPLARSFSRVSLAADGTLMSSAGPSGFCPAYAEVLGPRIRAIWAALSARATSGLAAWCQSVRGWPASTLYRPRLQASSLLGNGITPTSSTAGGD